MPYREFEFINQVQSLAAAEQDALQLGIGDDAALIQIDNTYSYAICTDTSVLNGHFTAETPVESIGYKSLTVNISDLAAMGADPLFYLVNLTVPELSEQWCDRFLAGLQRAAEPYGMICIGGDTTKGPETISITAIGRVETTKVLKRSGASIGDLICVSGELGLGAFALHHPEHAELQQYLHYPKPRVELGAFLKERATAAIDISDGLSADLNHILESSGVGAKIEAHRVPGSTRLRDYVSEDEAYRYVLTGGDDYQLCFTLPEAFSEEVCAQHDVTVIGEIIAEPGLIVVDESEQVIQLEQLGFTHF